MRRFFFDTKMRTGDLVTLSEEESYHIARVLRLQPETEIEVMDGQGGVFTARIIELGRNVAVRLLARQEQSDAGRLGLWVGQGVLKGKKMDGAIQQCTELGVARLTPFFSSRCQGRPDELRGRQKSERWNRIVVSACKQCRRAEQMQVDEVVDYTAMLSLAAPGFRPAQVHLLGGGRGIPPGSGHDDRYLGRGGLHPAGAGRGVFPDRDHCRTRPGLADGQPRQAYPAGRNGYRLGSCHRPASGGQSLSVAAEERALP